MLKELKFCAGSIAKKDYVPALKHFSIENGRVKGFNGTLALSSPIAFDICCKPNASKLIQAVANCEETIQLTLTPAGRLSIKSGVFKVLVECINEETPHVEPEGDIVKFNGEALFEGIKLVDRFIGTDASRPWAQGILIKDKSLFATNNVILVQYWLGIEFPHIINIPRPAIKEMLRIGEPPIYAQLTDNSITFHYEGDRWLRTQLYDANWPDLSKILDKPFTPFPIDDRLFKGLEVLKKFVDKMGSIWIKDAVLSTTANLGDGAEYYIPDMQWDGRFNNEMLELLEGVVEEIDWSLWPNPCLFTGAKKRLRGAIVGQRL
jgi:DNA polymerase III sliding clamp (beta) subunit (PCNA family)